MSYIEEIGNTGGDNLQKKLDKWGYTPGKGFASTASQKNTANNTTRENSNDKQNNSTMEAGQAGAGGVNAAISAAQQSGQNFGNSQQDSNSQGQREVTIATMQFSKAAAATAEGGLKAAVQVSFLDKTPMTQEERQINNTQNRVIAQYETRFKTKLHPDVINAVRNLTDPAELTAALKTMANTRPAESNDDVLALKAAIQATGGSFEVISSEEIQQQQNQ